MEMGSYGQTVRTLQPVIPLLFDALSEALGKAASEHADKGYRRVDDQHYFAATARREVLHQLGKVGLIALNDDGDRPLLPMSSLLLRYGGLALWIFKTQKTSPSGVQHEIPLPGTSTRKREFWRQDPMLEVMQTDNILLLWSEDRGVLETTMTLVRPLGGDHRRANLRFEWAGPLRREMAKLSAADLDELRPAIEHPTLGAEDAG